ncbi:hypothetical protein CC80DRAFT_11792 [Byssothecium circinans]|uniref:Transcription factor domain-containing protein n=1 Tax=Byssothecium circinans TaxID=147558 RepID=A0A6A5UIR6_9PLEO|nr:hypothetical protein CC80DRAFT_11792 [Byssothecium circinans]
MKCGGYKKEIRFRAVEKPLAARTTTTDRSRNTTPPSRPHQASDASPNQAQLPADDQLAHEDPSDSPTHSWPPAEGFDFSFSDIGLELPWHILPSFEMQGSNDEPFHFTHDSSDPTHEHHNLPFNLDLENFLLASPPTPSSLEVPALTYGPHTEEETDSLEKVASLFHQQTCEILSIYDEPSKNPWSTLIWPMVKDSTALFHAVAAMTCLQLSRSEPAMSERGLVHIQKSTQALEIELNSGTMQIEAALASMIALGFAETWDFQKSPTGRDHIRGARVLLQDALSNRKFAQPTGEASARLRFLANTWIYMDVIQRLTSDCGSPLNSELLSLFGTYEPYTCTDELDPLMGYSSTLFPIIGRVGDLVTQVRTRRAKRNSPVIISRAIELRKAIERWTPAVDLEQVENPTSNMSDAIQTAEAYRWCTYLYLQQAVPELPNLSSVGEIAQKTLVYLATISSTSHTTIVHTYPLMVAGSEAVDLEDREFVRERWRVMSKRMVTDIVDRCLEITEEVWRRRDEYIAEVYGGGMSVTSGISPTDRVDSGGSDVLTESPNGKEGSPQASLGKRKGAMRSEFPISAAFKKGVDALTRSGNVEYTVQGRLHFLGVMEDWGWEVLLG